MSVTRGNIQRATVLMQASNGAFGTLFEKVVHASVVKGHIEAVVRDFHGWLWLCREEVFEEIGLAGSGQRPNRCCLVPVWGPAPDPIDPLPVGYSPETTAVLAQAAKTLDTWRVRRSTAA